MNFVLTLMAAGAGWALATLGTRRFIDQRIDERLAAMQRKPEAPREPVHVFPPPVVEEEVPVEVIAVISAAICAFLGKPARIRRVRRIPSGMNPWAQVGRVSVMAS